MNVLFVGLGGIGQRHLRNLLELIGSDLNVFAYRVRNASFVLDNKLNIQNGVSLEEYYPIKVCYSLDEAWKRQIDIVFICNPSSMHYEILRQAVEHSCDVFVEKPISDKTDGLESIIHACAEKNLVTFVGYQNRFHPCIKRAKHIVESQAIGSIVAINAEIGEDIKRWHRYEDYRTMYACQKQLGGGVVLSQIHELDYIPYLLSAMPSSVFAMGGKLSGLEIDVEDVASILLSFDIDGKKVLAHIHEDYLQNPPSRHCKIIGTEGKLEFDLLNAELTQYGVDGQTVLKEKFQFERNDMFLEEISLFFDAVQTRKESAISLQEGLKSLKIAETVKQSIAIGIPVKL